MSSVRNVGDLSPDAVAGIDAILASIRRDNGVHIPLAVESGSRAWGFPSPDSDYDCRFIFVRSLDQYLTPWPKRDVIETPVEGELDVNGWELSKALRLLVKGNAVVLEWLVSPLVYTAKDWFRDDLLRFARAFADRGRIRSHYLHLGLRQRSVYFDGDLPVALKKVFYVLRPAAALRWLRLHPAEALPPMHFPSLVEEGDWPESAAALVADLLARKAVTREMGSGALPGPLRAFIEEEFDLAAKDASAPLSETTAAREEAERLFRSIVLRLNDSPDGIAAQPVGQGEFPA